MLNTRLLALCVTFGLALSVILSALTSSKAQDPSESSSRQTAPQQKEEKSEDKEGARTKEVYQQESVKDSFKIDTNMVQLDVRVIDRFNHPVFTLNKKDFAVFENKSEQTIESVKIEEVPLSVGLIIDTSESMRTKLRTVIEGTLSLVKEMRPQDEAFVVQFKSKPDLVQEFTHDKSKLEKSLRGLNPGGGTSLFDAIIAGAGFARDYGKQRRKALIVITDGLERNSSIKEKDLIDAITQNEVQLHMIGFLDDDDEPSVLFYKSPIRKAKELISKLTDASGGGAYFPNDISEMPFIASEITKDLRSQYIISYYPRNDKHDGTYRAVRVEVNHKDKYKDKQNKLVARTRLGYFSRSDKDATDH